MKIDEIIHDSPYLEIRELIGAKGELETASEKIAELYHQDELKADVLRGMVLFSQARPLEALKLANKVLSRKNEIVEKDIILHALHSKIYSLLLIGDLPEVKETIKGLRIEINEDEMSPSERVSVQEALAMLYQVQASYYGLYIGDYERGIELGQKALELGKKASSTSAIAWAYYILSAIYQHNEDIELGLEYAEKGLLISHKKDYKTPLSIIYITLGRLYGLKGEIPNLVKYMNEAFRLGNIMKNKIITDLTTGEIGYFHASRGNYDQAIEQFKLGLQLAEERNDSFVIIKRLNDLGHIYRLKGELRLALKMFKECLVMSTKMQNQFLESRTYYAMGSVYFDQGDYTTANEIFQKSLFILSSIAPKSVLYSSVLYELVMLNLESNQKEDSKSYLGQLETISKQTSNEKTRLNCQLAKALMLKASPRLKNKIKAQGIFKSIGENMENEHSIITFALLNLCGLLINEYKSTGEKEVFDEIMVLSQQLYSMGQEKNAYPTIIKALLLQSKLFLIEGNLELIEDRLDKALKLAKRKGLGNLLNQIDHEQKRIKAELDKWKTLLASNASLQERISAAALDSYIKRVRRMVDFQQELSLEN